MGMTPDTIIAAQTAAVATVVPFQVSKDMLPATLLATNLAGAESVAILFSVDGGTTFEPLAQDGADLILTLTANTFAIISPMMLGVTKTATAGLTGVFIMNRHPNDDKI